MSTRDWADEAAEEFVRVARTSDHASAVDWAAAKLRLIRHEGYCAGFNRADEVVSEVFRRAANAGA